MNKLKLCYILCLIITIAIAMSIICLTKVKAEDSYSVETTETEAEPEEFEVKEVTEEVIEDSTSHVITSMVLMDKYTYPLKDLKKIKPTKRYISVSKADIYNKYKSKIIDNIAWNKKVLGFKEGKWFRLKDGNYIKYKLLSNKQVKYTDKKATIKTRKKCYMPISAITCKTSYQYKIRKHYAYTGEYGISQVDGRFCCALGSYYGVEIGQYFDLILENDKVIPCIAGDAKADCDTDPKTHSYTKYNKCMSEFVIGNTRILNSYIHGSGNCSSIKGWNSPIETIRIYEKSCFEKKIVLY